MAIEKEWNVGWGLTQMCNMKCIHCYNDSGKASSTEVSLSEARKIVDKLRENNVKSINYGTGESGLYPIFWDIVKYVHESGIIQGLTTNGWSVNKKTIGLVREHMNDVDVSVDFPSETDHNGFRQSKSAWKWANCALTLMKESGMPRSIVTALTSLNCNEKAICGMCDLARKYDAELRINWFRPTGRGKFNQYLKLSHNQVYDAVKLLLKNAEIKAIPDPLLSSMLGIDARKGCACGIDSFRITPDKTVVPCVYFTKEMKNLSILESSFESIINSEPFRLIKNRMPHECEGCEFLEKCMGGCASRAFLEFGDINKPDCYCYKVNGLKQNPLEGVDFEYSKGAKKVHENYLCTLIVKP